MPVNVPAQVIAEGFIEHVGDEAASGELVKLATSRVRQHIQAGHSLCAKIYDLVCGLYD